MSRLPHRHDAASCRHDSEGPSIWWLCGYDPKFTSPARQGQGPSEPDEGYRPHHDDPDFDGLVEPPLANDESLCTYCGQDIASPDDGTCDRCFYAANDAALAEGW